MNIIEEGFVYEVENTDGSSQKISFVQKAKSENTNEMITLREGTTNEEVLTMLISRLNSQNAKCPSRHTALAITKIEEALHWLDARSKDRDRRGVLGTNQR